jgi:hypothetical protein
MIPFVDGFYDVVCYFYDPIKAPLLREAVLPALRHCAVAHHLERHWLSGPHLRIRLHGTADDTAAAAAHVAAELRTYLATHGSRTIITAEQFTHDCAAAGRAELIAPPYPPLRPDNSVVVEAVDAPAEGVTLRAGLLHAGLPALAQTVRHLGTAGDTPGSRLGVVIAALAAHAAAYPRGVGLAALSYVSHVEEFMLHEDPDGRVRAAFEQRWRRHADSVTATVDTIVGAAPNHPVEQAWLRWSTTVRPTIAALDHTDLPLAGAADLAARARLVGTPELRQRWDFSRRTSFSPFHRELAGLLTDDTPALADMSVHRYLTNVLYQLLAICDVLAAERYLGAYLVSRAVEQITGVSWQQRLAAFRTRPGVA